MTKKNKVDQIFKEIGEAILNRDPLESMKVFQSTPRCHAYPEKMIFMSAENEKEWEELDDSIKKDVMEMLKETTQRMENAKKATRIIKMTTN